MRPGVIHSMGVGDSTFFWGYVCVCARGSEDLDGVGGIGMS